MRTSTAAAAERPNRPGTAGESSAAETFDAPLRSATMFTLVRTVDGLPLMQTDDPLEVEVAERALQRRHDNPMQVNYRIDGVHSTHEWFTDTPGPRDRCRRCAVAASGCFASRMPCLHPAVLRYYEVLDQWRTLHPTPKGCS